MRVLIKAVNSDFYEVEKNKDYETVLSEIHLAQQEKTLYQFKDIKNKRVALNVNNIVSIIEEREEPRIPSIGIQGIKSKKH